MTGATITNNISNTKTITTNKYLKKKDLKTVFITQNATISLSDNSQGDIRQ